jgi:transposase
MAGVDPHRLVFLDETGAKTDMTRAYARAQKGQRVIDFAPGGHWNTTTLVAGLRRHGAVAPMVLDGPMDSLAFAAYVEQLLIPALPVGAIVVLDNLSAHKSPRIAPLLQEAGIELRYLPPYSPDLNPIEQMWSKVKNHLKAIKARTQETLMEAIGEAIAKVTPKDANRFFLHCGVGIII